jgi:hypothetical protein
MSSKGQTSSLPPVKNHMPVAVTLVMASTGNATITDQHEPLFSPPCGFSFHIHWLYSQPTVRYNLFIWIPYLKFRFRYFYPEQAAENSLKLQTFLTFQRCDLYQYSAKIRAGIINSFPTEKLVNLTSDTLNTSLSCSAEVMSKNRQHVELFKHGSLYLRYE